MTTLAMPDSPSAAVAVSETVPVSGEPGLTIETVGGVQSAAAATVEVGFVVRAVNAAVEKTGAPMRATAARVPAAASSADRNDTSIVLLTLLGRPGEGLG